MVYNIFHKKDLVVTILPSTNNANTAPNPEAGRLERLAMLGGVIGAGVLHLAERAAKELPGRVVRLGAAAFVGASIALGHVAGSVLEAATTPDYTQEVPKQDAKKDSEAKRGPLGEEQIEFVKTWLPESFYKLITDLTTENADDFAKNIVLVIGGDPNGPQQLLLEKFFKGAKDEEIELALKDFGITDIESQLEIIKDSLIDLHDIQKVNIINKTLGKELLEEPDEQVIELKRSDMALAA